MKKTIINGIIFGLSFLITVWLGSLVLGALTMVSNGTPLTATTWNDMIGNFFWKSNSNSIYYMSGNVGIGTSNPKGKLNISSTTTLDHPYAAGIIVEGEGLNRGGRIASLVASDIEIPKFILYGARGQLSAPAAVSSASFLGTIEWFGYDGTNWGAAGMSPYISANTTEQWTNTNHGSSLNFGTVSNGTNTSRVNMTINHNGNIGIGTTNPTAKLHVSGGYVTIDGLGGTGGRTVCANASGQLYTDSNGNGCGDGA